MYVNPNLVLAAKTPKIIEEEPLDKKDIKKKVPVADPKKEKDKKKIGAGGKKDDEEEVIKVIPKVKITLDMIDEKSLEGLLKQVRLIYSKTPKLLLLFITLEDAEALGVDPEEISIRFLEDKLNQYLETKIIWEKEWVIKDWADRMENEVYPDEAVILFENLSLLPVELGFETLEVPTVPESTKALESSLKPHTKRFHCLY